MIQRLRAEIENVKKQVGSNGCLVPQLIGERGRGSDLRTPSLEWTSEVISGRMASRKFKDKPISMADSPQENYVISMEEDRGAREGVMLLTLRSLVWHNPHYDLINLGPSYWAHLFPYLPATEYQPAGSHS